MARCFLQLYSLTLQPFSTSWKARLFLMWTMNCTFCLHDVFLQRISNALHMFNDAWNNHSLLSEGNLSPMQLWVIGLARNTDQDIQLTQVKLVLATFIQPWNKNQCSCSLCLGIVNTTASDKASPS